MSDTNLAFLGAGNIAQAIIGGLLENGFKPRTIIAADPAEAQLGRLAERGVHTTADNTEAVEAAGVIVISVKPDVVSRLVAEIAPVARDKLIVSVAAGVTTATLAENLGEGAAIIRCMPNTPALVRRGMTGLVANRHVSVDQRRIAESIVGAIGEFLWFDEESALDAVTAISGSGPAYFFYVMEAMEEAARALGLPDGIAHKLVTQTALGAATMALTSEDSPGELRRRVTSPGGTTEAALTELADNGLVEAFCVAIRAAHDRSRSLSQS